ncbi:toll/interleukin-1 receptor domain-containing protein [Desulfobacter curvatus]|uniref:toll/interleukin-1 receptor domain-containing protein n=1 Tax=Desulfobacter curvatus TaxID=2290 RepID=UPI0003713C3C|nr:toll/interleukin-1 receptor domain-containing protein [Desulfobacter curvatus]
MNSFNELHLKTENSFMSEWDWEILIGLIKDELVVPVIGPEMLEVENDEGRLVPYYDLWGLEAGKEAGIETEKFGNMPLLYQVAGHILMDSKSRIRNINRLAVLVDYVVQRKTWSIPQVLEQIVDIKSFPLIVTTSIDHFLDKLMKKSGKPFARIMFAPGGAGSEIDLPSNFNFRQNRALMQLFGATSRCPGTCAVTEDDLIEFSWSLLDREYGPQNFYDYLQGKTVLLLGCNFPDWLGRFFVHALHANRKDVDLWYVSKNDDMGLRSFLERKGGKILSPYSPGVFIAELYDRWLKTLPEVEDVSAAAHSPDFEQNLLEPMKPGAVFISYIREDMESAVKIRSQMETAGIDTWMDSSALQSGDRWEAVIEERIRKASFFVPLISGSLNPDNWGGKRERFFLREWELARHSDSMRMPEDRYIRPLCLDDTTCEASFVRPFSKIHWSYAPGGKLDEAFIQSIREGIRIFRRARS